MRFIDRSTVLVLCSGSAFALLAGCQTVRPIAPPDPPLTLLSSGPLELPNECRANGAFTVTFTVATSGETEDVRALDAPACVEHALTAWVTSFRYQAPARATPSKLEWMMVTAPRERT